LRKFFLNKLPVAIPESEIRKHTYIVGGIGSGKSELIKILLYSDIKSSTKKSIVLIEPHGDLATEVSRLKYFYKNKTRLVYIDPYLKNGYTPCINPLQLDDKTEENIGRMTTALINTFEGLLGNDWSPRMKAMLMYCFPVLLRRDNSTLQDLKRFMDLGENANNSDLIKLGLNSPTNIQREYFKNDFQDKSLETTKRGIRDRISALLASPVFSNIVLGKNTFDLEGMVNSGQVIIFNVSKGKFGPGVTEAFGALLVSILNYYAFKRDDIKIKKERVPTNIILDEFPIFISKDKEVFKSFLSETRKYSMYLTMAHQYVGQLGIDLKHAVEENVGVKIQGRSKKDEELRKLKVGQFKVKSGNREEILIQVPDCLVNYKRAMSRDQWKEVAEFQIENYYKKIECDAKGQGNETSTNQNEENQFQEKRSTEKFKKFKPNL